ncbi:hypothetical protein KTH_28180 [Thermosporothrix hazakensis]|uniref:Uncharacterized protein n=1 Tax=Thermosporothrix sp. COM3 TaxID=2490863 RepID=A0A455SPZ4_9CHLR|nr:hypothetical protein KTC_45110 [Thermosporothrix sp. COM3]GCE47949.1 hypothetical protein KTH_28180 [Thermosporothrix hazakensis]
MKDTVRAITLPVSGGIKGCKQGRLGPRDRSIYNVNGNSQGDGNNPQKYGA